MAKADLTLQNSAIALQTKVNLLAWIGLIPGQTAMHTKMEVDIMVDTILADGFPEDLMKTAKERVDGMNVVMDDGLKIIIAKLNSDKCIKCAEDRCINLQGIVKDLLHDKPIVDIQEKITINFGDISVKSISGMPGHQDPNIRVVHVGDGKKNLIDVLLDAITGGSRSNQRTDPMEMMIPDFETPDRDKMH
jgi:hypothetical protein